jgi:hypothetical protein
VQDAREPRLDRAALVAELRRQADASKSDAARGQLAGLTSAGPAPLRTGNEVMTDAFRAGVLAGRIYGRLLDEHGAVDRHRLLAAGIYAASLAQAAVQGQFEEPSPEVLVKEHTVACIRVAWRGAQLDEADERIMFDWLLDELGVAPSETLLASYATMRRRRLERLARDG